MFKSMLIGSVLLLGLIGCTDGYRGKILAYGSAHKVVLYSGGVVVREWVSTGVVTNEPESDGFYFVDKATGKLVRVTGDLVIMDIE